MEKFAKTFWTPYENVRTLSGESLSKREVIGKEFIVIDELDRKSYDREEVGTVYIVELDGGIVIHAFPEEVENEWQIKAGKEKYL